MNALDIDTAARINARFGTEKEWAIIFKVWSPISDEAWTEAKNAAPVSRATAVSRMRDWRDGKFSPAILPRKATDAKIVRL